MLSIGGSRDSRPRDAHALLCARLQDLPPPSYNCPPPLSLPREGGEERQRTIAARAASGGRTGRGTPPPPWMARISVPESVLLQLMHVPLLLAGRGSCLARMPRHGMPVPTAGPLGARAWRTRA